MNEPAFQINEQEFQEFQALMQRLEASETDDFLELATLLGRDPKTDLIGADLSGTDLRGKALSGADLSGADLSGADLSNADLSGADLSNADLSNADLSNADLSNADLSNADLSNADFFGANLSNADFFGAKLTGAHRITPTQVKASRELKEAYHNFEFRLMVDREESKVSILNISIDNLSMHELLEQLQSGVVFFPNVDHIMKLQKDSDFYRAYTLADYKVCDSQVLMYASKFLGTPFKEKVSGSDLFPRFCEFHKNNDNITVFLLGGAEGVAKKAKKRINQRVNREIIIGSHSTSFGFERDEQECLEIIEMINQSKATVLAVGVGAPKQEKWIYKYEDKLHHVKIFMAVGATLDFEAGVLERSPKWMSNLGVEWLFRIYCDPQRFWKRYLVENLPFSWLLLKQKLGSYISPRWEPEGRTDKPVNTIWGLSSNGTETPVKAETPVRKRV